MARIWVEIDVPGWTVQQLQEAIVDENDDDVVHPNSITPYDIIGNIYSGYIGPVVEVINEGMSDVNGMLDYYNK